MVDRLKFYSTRWEEAETCASPAYAPMHVADCPGPCSVRIRHTAAAPLTVGLLDVEDTLSFEAQARSTVCLVTVHRGTMTDTTAGRERTWGPGQTFLLALPDEPSSGRVDAARATLTLFDPALLTAVAAEDGTPRGPVRLTGRNPKDPAANRRLGAAVAFVRDHVLRSPAPDGLVLATAARLLAAVTLTALPNTTTGHPTPPGDHHSKSSRTLRRAMAFIEDNAYRDISLADIAQALHLTPRAVQYAFARHHHTTPLAHLRQVRLARAHADLTTADPTGTTVSQIAARWGYPHQGRFASAYRATYGRSPSTTLRSLP